MTDSYTVLIQDSYDTADNRRLLYKAAEDSASGVAALYGENAACELGYDRIFSLDAEKVLGIAFLEKWIPECGWLNPQLPSEDFLEFFCRLVKAAGSCAVVCTEEDRNPGSMEENHTDETAFLYAYMIRLHLNTLHKRNITDIVFAEVCKLMQQKGCFGQFQQYMNYLLSNEQEYESIARFTAPFVILRGDDTCGGVLQQFADDLARALAANNQAVIEVGGDDIDYDRLQGMVSKGVVGFQAAALEIDFFRKIHGPKFQFWFDNPLRFEGVLRNLPEDNYVLCQDADHAELIRKYYHTENAVQFPPGGMEPADIPDFQADKMRPYDVIFMGRYFPDEPDNLSDGARKFYEFMLAHSWMTFEQGLMEMDPGAASASNEEFVERMTGLKQACRAVIGHFRNRVVAAILNAGITVHVYGEEWKQIIQTGDVNTACMVVHPEVSTEGSMKEFGRAKIGLNIMSWYKSGMTERVANIMLAGAVCLSDETAYLTSHLTEGEDIVLYRLTELDRLPDMIQELLDNPVKRQAIAAKGYQKAVKEFSWNARAVQLIDLAESISQR